MSYSKVNLIIKLPELIKRINRRISPDRVNEINSAFETDGLTIYIRLKQSDDRRYSVKITENGEVYNPIMQTELLASVFDWLKNIDQKRQNDRVSIFKNELFEKIWHPSNMKFLEVE